MQEETLTRYQKYYAAHREARKADSKARRDRDPVLHNARAKASKRKDWDSYLAKNRVTNQRLLAALKAKAIAALGGRCGGCGYDTDIRALQVDHVFSDGKEDRKRFSQWRLYKTIVENGAQGRYQCLCANCNVIKRMETGEHPPGQHRAV